ncbi:GGDEF domain-containing protein [Sphingopyxis sp. XHP0097]|uniref:diguanylate cyclase n=1 Tax=Sphingopyxis jiangsuensis TaxID=2871171 RepID=A0ABS7MAS0_9SPHN|nr:MULTISPECIES: GGDEF domain-containing protein [Sphingopyxis]MBY4636130.1 GGDEF domain-containing protein [Sphingopyxis jiangsuensis]
MTAAFVLGINLFIAGIFAVAFAVVAAISRSAHGAKWISLGYATGMATILFEYLLPTQTNPVPVGIAVFLTYLLAMTFCVVGVARHYGFDPRWPVIAGIWIVTIFTIPLTFSIPYASPHRVMLYQSPYFAMQLLILLALIESGRRLKLDLLLAGVMATAALIYASRPLIAWQLGQASLAQDYMATDYAAISQSLGAGTLVAQALVMLLVMMRDTTAEMIVRSETDPLSSVLNRRGFEFHAEAALEQGDAVLVVADLDYFKQINDNFGHAAGDGVIAHFAAIMRDAAPDDAIVGRIGGEEFAVLLPDAMLSDGRLYAETVRGRFATKQLPILGVNQRFTASFGVAQRTASDSLADLSRRADEALYRAKAGGRNLVRVELSELRAANEVA